MQLSKIFQNIYQIILKTGMVVLFILPTNSNYSQTISIEVWKLAKDKQDIQIYTRQMANSKLKELRAHTFIKTSVDNVIATLQDVDNYNKWMVYVKNSALLKKISDDEMYIYSEAKLPWPFNNRDIANHINVYWSEEKDTATLVIDGIPDYIPEKEGIVRMPISKGHWYVYQLDKQTTKIEYIYGGDPGGSIPSWVVNLFIVDGPYKSLVNLKRYLEIKPVE